MKAADAIAEILKREGVDTLIGYPVNHIIEHAARADLRTVIVRQERIGLHMADAMARLSSGDRIGVFAMQHGPGAENAFGGGRASVRRVGADPGHADGLPAGDRPRAAELQLDRRLSPGHQVVRAGDERGGDPERPPPGVHPAPKRPPGAPRSSRCRATCSPRTSRSRSTTSRS